MAPAAERRHPDLPQRLQSLYAPTKLLVEDNAAVLQRWHSRERRRLAAPIYLADSQAEPQYIYSQLYSIHMANQLKADHEAARRFTYDVVVRLRFDFDLESAVPEEELASVTRDRDTIRVGHPLKTRHGHPGGGGGCKLCAVMPHPGPHANDVCDIVAFGSSPAMDAYAGLYDCCLDLYARTASDNEATYALRRGWKPSRSTTRRGYVYVTVHDRDYVACFYPERLLREHLVGYRLVNSALDGRLLREEAEDSWLVKIHVPMQLPLWPREPWCRLCASCARHSAGRSAAGSAQSAVVAARAISAIAAAARERSPPSPAARISTDTQRR